MNNYYTSTLIKDLRINYNYTIQKVANLLGVSKAAVSKWENGDDITTEHLFDLAKLYNVSFSELYNGKLNNEDNNDYWKRNFDLSNFELEESINNKNVENLKTLFEHCSMVKTKFFELLPRWAKEELSNNELEEFKFIKQYFKFDNNYFYVMKEPRRIIITNENSERKFVNETLKEISSYSKDKYQWELNKLYNFTYDYKSDDICKSGNIKALEYMLMSFSQIEKDLFLYANLHIEEDSKNTDIFGGIKKTQRDRTEEEIENIPFFKTIINSGANALFLWKSFNIICDNKILDYIEGKTKKLDNSIYRKYQLSSSVGKTSIHILNNWKLFSYDDYLEFVDKKTTDYLKDIVNLKDSNPKLFYEKKLKREQLDF